MHFINTYRAILKKRFGVPVLKVPINGGFSCPNRDGTKSTGGCLFCDNRSFSPAAHILDVAPQDQLLQRVAHHRSATTLFLPYLQPFSNTYGPFAKLRETYESLLAVPRVIGLAVGTRPDCFTDELFTYLGALAERTYLSIELGLQSAHDVTLSRCNRGHTFTDFTASVNRLAAAGVETVAHVMLGLPGETSVMMRQTAQALATLPCTGIKIHQLMVIQGTPFADMFISGDLEVLTIDAYADRLADFLSYLRPDQQIHRIMADATLENGLLAPLWSADKPGSLQRLYRFMETNNVMQGHRCLSA